MYESRTGLTIRLSLSAQAYALTIPGNAKAWGVLSGPKAGRVPMDGAELYGSASYLYPDRSLGVDADGRLCLQVCSSASLARKEP